METLVRPDLARIVLTGSESVGKTSLSARLSTHYGVEFVPEFVREYAAQKGAPLDFRDHGPIAKGQAALENAYIVRARSLLILDTDLVSTVVYCHHYFGRCPQFIEDAAVERLATRYLLLDIDVPWVADGVRDREQQRAEVQSLFADTLARFGAAVTGIAGDWDTRFTHAVHTIDDVLRTRNADV